MSHLKSSIVSFGLVLAVSLGSVSWAQRNPETRRAVARVRGETIYEDDLPPTIGAKLLDLENQEYELKMKALIELVNRRLLENEAKSRGTSVDELLRTVDSDLPQFSVSELEGFYLARRHDIDKPLDEVRPQVEKAFLEARREQAREDYINGLRQEAGLTILLVPPRAKISVDPSRLLGNPAAPVTIVEFADFECPYCQSMQPVLKEILKKYPGRVELGFRDFPLRSIHPQAQQAAEAARCAGEQGKFWEYHDLLFAKHSRLDSDGLQEHAHTLGLDLQRFSECLESGRFKGGIESDLQLGMAFGVRATPTIYINGVAMTGSQPAAAFEKIIDAELGSAKAKEPAP